MTATSPLVPPVSADTSTTRVVLVDDSADFRRVLAMLLRTHESLEVVAEAEDGQAGLLAVEQHRPDILITDLQMPGMDGIDLTRAVRATDPELPIVLLTAYPSEDAIEQAEAAGATRFVPKRGDIASVVPATILELLDGAAG